MSCMLRPMSQYYRFKTPRESNESLVTTHSMMLGIRSKHAFIMIWCFTYLLYDVLHKTGTPVEQLHNRNADVMRAALNQDLLCM